MKTFELTTDHIKLLRSGNVWWDGAECGAPGIDPKRPYGDSDVYFSIADILELQYADEHDDWFTQIHRQTETALQIVLATGQFLPGTYEATGCNNKWKLKPTGE